MIEAMLYQKLEQDIVKCDVCKHQCEISNGKRGICGVRENRQGTLYALNFGKTIAAAIDPIEKKPIYHFMPGTKTYSFATVGCNLRCSWCQNWEISQSPKLSIDILGYDVAPEEHVRRAIQYGCPSISYTYSEPTIFLEYALETMKLAHEEGLKNIWVTNGYMSKRTLQLIIPYLDAANVDFKGPENDVYEKYCGGSSEGVMENLVILHDAGVHLEVTTLIVPGVNDKLFQVEAMVDSIVNNLGCEVPWHISRFFPHWKMTDVLPTPLSTLAMAKEIGIKAGIKTIHLGNV